MKHFVSNVASEFSIYDKSFSKVYALLNNVSNIAKQLPNMEALYDVAYVKTAIQKFVKVIVTDQIGSKLHGVLLPFTLHKYNKNWIHDMGRSNSKG